MHTSRQIIAQSRTSVHPHRSGENKERLSYGNIPGRNEKQDRRDCRDEGRSFQDDSLKRVHVYVKIMKPIDTSLLSEEEVKNIHTVAENMVREAYAVLPGPYAKG